MLYNMFLRMRKGKRKKAKGKGQRAEFRVQRAGVRVQSSGGGVQGSEGGVQGSEFRVQGVEGGGRRVLYNEFVFDGVFGFNVSKVLNFGKGY